MCYRLTTKIFSPNVMIFKTALLLFVFCFAECATGSCLSYGHSCWGAHGKRNGEDLNNGLLRARDEYMPSSTRWYLSRLVQAPAGSRFDIWKNSEDRTSGPRKQTRNNSDVELEGVKRSDERDDTNDETFDEPEPEEVVFMEETPKTLGQKLRLYKIMKKNADKIK